MTNKEWLLSLSSAKCANEIRKIVCECLEQHEIPWMFLYLWFAEEHKDEVPKETDSNNKTELEFNQGDEVIWHETDQDSFKAVILDDDADVYDYVFIFTEVGCIERASVKSLELTGKHYDNLETLLKFLQMDSADHICKNCKSNQWNNFIEGSICKNRDSSNFGELTSGKYATFTGCEYWQKKED